MSELLTEGKITTVNADGVEEQARRAVSAFRALQPTLTSYARILSGRQDVRVDMAATDNGSTDGKRIFFRPPIALGDSTQHVRRLCDKRDGRGLMTCRACAIREEVLCTIYHEIAHICFDSFSQTTDNDKRRAIEFAVREARGPWSEQIAERIKTAPKNVINSYIGLASLINEYLPFLLNCLEDARVNSELFKARNGVRAMFAASAQQIFNEGYECADGKGGTRIQMWRSAPLNSQVMIGVFAKASGYDNYTDWFHPRVVEALDDEQLTRLIRELDTVRNAKGVYNLSFRVLARLRDLGFCSTPKDPDPEPKPEPEKSDEPTPVDEPPSDDSGDGDSSSSGDGPEGQGQVDGNKSGTSDDSSSGTNAGSESGNKDESEGSEAPRDGAQRDDSDGPSKGHGDPEPNPVRSDAGSDPSEGDPSSKVGLSPGASPDGSSTELPQEAGSKDAPADVSPELGDTGESKSSGGLADERGNELDVPDSDSRDERRESSTDDTEPIDTGADDGYGGTRVLDDNYEEPEMGTPEEVNPILLKWGQHEEKPKSVEGSSSEQKAKDAVDKAVIQGLYFTKPSSNIWGVREHYYNKPIIINGKLVSRGWMERNPGLALRRGQGVPIDIPESILSPALMHLRRIFTDNKRGKLDINRKSGRVNASVLGKRAWNGDPRLFAKKTRPGKKDYFVVLCMDISGSTMGLNLTLEKRAIFAKAELLDRLGIPFVLLAHTGSKANNEHCLDMYHIKDENEPWNDSTKERLVKLGPASANLDGHALEFLRKVADKSRATDKIIMYYSDGKMPLENFDEELEILQREISVCKSKGYTLLGVGIRTDSPRAHGLETIQVNRDEDLVKVVEFLEKRLSGTVKRR